MIVAIVTDGILTAAFVLRVAGMTGPEEKAANLRLKSFQILSFAAPLLWCVWSLLPLHRFSPFLGWLMSL
jgi:hypothetical protein